VNKRLAIVLSLGVALSISNTLRAAPRASVRELDYCEDYRQGQLGPQDYPKALACLRGNEDWLWVALMQVNGDGTPADLAAARATLDRLKFKDADAEALERIIRKRSANPTGKVLRVEFCRDVAATTPSVDSCEAQQQARKTAATDARLNKIKGDLDQRVRLAFGRAQEAFETFVRAESDRIFQKYIDGTARDQEAMDQEKRARRHFVASITLILKGPAAHRARARTFPEADRELNVVYNSMIASFAEFIQASALHEYKATSRAAQHEWVRYRDAMGALAVARWPELRDAQAQARALVTEDRIRELHERQ